MTEIAQRVRTVLGGVLEMDPAAIPADAAPGVIERWDSLRHMTLVAALEDEFEFRFSDLEMTELLNLPLILDVVTTKLSADD